MELFSFYGLIIMQKDLHGDDDDGVLTVFELNCRFE